MKKGVLSRKLKARLIEFSPIANDASLTDDEIASRFGVSALTVCRMRHMLGIRKTHFKYKGTPSRLRGKEDEFRKLNNIESDHAIAKRFGVGRASVMRWRAQLGLKKDWSKKWILSPHPHGFLGRKHSPEELNKQSRAIRDAWANPKSKFNSPAFRSRLSARMSQLHESGFLREGFSSRKAGVRPDIGGYRFKSSWEANYARYLNLLKSQGRILDWSYEPRAFRFSENTYAIQTYRPDFRITPKAGDEYFVEVKGWMTGKCQHKITLFRKEYPAIRLEIVSESEYRALCKIADQIPGWERCKRST